MLRQILLQKAASERAANEEKRATSREQRETAESASRIARDQAQIARDKSGSVLDEARAQYWRAGGARRGPGGPSYAEQRRALFEDLIEQGMTPEEANRRVRLEFGLTVPSGKKGTTPVVAGAGGGTRPPDEFDRAREAYEGAGGAADPQATARYRRIVAEIAKRRGMVSHAPVVVRP